MQTSRWKKKENNGYMSVTKLSSSSISFWLVIKWQVKNIYCLLAMWVPPVIHYQHALLFSPVLHQSFLINLSHVLSLKSGNLQWIYIFASKSCLTPWKTVILTLSAHIIATTDTGHAPFVTALASTQFYFKQGPNNVPCEITKNYLRPWDSRVAENVFWSKTDKGRKQYELTWLEIFTVLLLVRFSSFEDPKALNGWCSSPV